MQKNKSLKQQVIIVAGMHRSGTQMLTQIIAAYGIPMWREYSGHSEDKEFMDFHREILEHDLGHHWMVPKTAHFSEQDKVRALDLLKTREHLPVWGWKDPRTTLFLNDWDQLIDEMSVLFIWRRCADVVASCMRRAKQEMTLIEAWNNAKGGAREKFYKTRYSLIYRIRFTQLWILYNEQILQFMRTTNRNHALFNIADVVTNPELVATHLRKFLLKGSLIADQNAIKPEKISKPAPEHIIPFWLKRRVLRLEETLLASSTRSNV